MAQIACHQCDDRLSQYRTNLPRVISGSLTFFKCNLCQSFEFLNFPYLSLYHNDITIYYRFSNRCYLPCITSLRSSLVFWYDTIGMINDKFLQVFYIYLF